MLDPGTIIKTSYNTGPYIIKSRSGLCICPEDCLPAIGGKTFSPEHYHYICTKEGVNGEFYLNGFDKNNYNVWNGDYLIVLSTEGVQKQMF